MSHEMTAVPAQAGQATRLRMTRGTTAVHLLLGPRRPGSLWHLSGDILTFLTWLPTRGLCLFTGHRGAPWECQRPYARLLTERSAESWRAVWFTTAPDRTHLTFYWMSRGARSGPSSLKDGEKPSDGVQTPGPNEPITAPSPSWLTPGK